MLIHKKNTPYGYTALIRYDVKNPRIHIIEKGGSVTLKGEAEITVVRGQASLKRSINTMDNKHSYDMLETGDTSRIPLNVTLEVRSKDDSVIIIEDNISDNKVNEFLNPVKSYEDEPSSDDLKYIEEM